MTSRVDADLPPDLACLDNVDKLLRCPICLDFLHISMMTKCSHNFCSLCIRKYLCFKPQCPVCYKQATEQDLRNNRILDELVVNFQAARQQLSNPSLDSPPITPKTPASAVKGTTARERGQKSSSGTLSRFLLKLPKTLAATEAQGDASTSLCVERGRRKTTGPYTNLRSATAPDPVSVKEEPMDVEEASVHVLVSVKQEDTFSHSVSTGVETPHSSSPSNDAKPVIKVDCPVCSVGVSQQFINKHLDTCLSSGEKKESLRSSPGNVRRPMTKLVYNLLSMHELKRRLKETYLSVKGSRDQLIKRHKDFVHIYNAECDSLSPKSAEDIAKEVEDNEKMRIQLKGKTKPVMVFTKNHTEKDIDDMHSTYRKQHSTDFSRLIAQVRGHLETMRPTHIKQEVIADAEDEENTLSPDQDAGSRSSLVVKAEDGDGVEESSAGGIESPPSPTDSDVSVSSSISDIFGPEPVTNHEAAECTSLQKRKSSATGDDAASSPILGKRRRKK
ncbi:E3 ubiquitin-protein ligase RAD18 [Platichthys flesus]|uniref:E3 ubiquitin-protein ligase RAD18 n=1 Tax=Platichthys flesus TaxID=8260 RepID=UPI002DB7DDCF|nr:E3 ubiquitin-protein ligase RAD18 [Platichthys flesus]